MPRVALFIALAWLTGCSPHPDVDGRMSAHAQAATYPTLRPLGPLLAALPDTDEDFGTDTLVARAAALRVRAARLRRMIVDPTTQARMQDALARRPQ